MSKRNLDTFMNQQIHVTGTGNLNSPRRGEVGPAVVSLTPGESTIELHLHQTSKVHELHLSVDTKPIQLSQLDVSVIPIETMMACNSLGK